MKKKITHLYLLTLITIIILTTNTLAFNDPGHDSLYVLKLGDSNITGSINVSDSIRTQRIWVDDRLFGPYLTIRADGVASSNPNKIIGTAAGLEIISTNELIIGSGGTVRFGSMGAPTAINVTGQIISQGKNVCLANGTNCPDLGDGFEGTLPINQGGTGASTADGALSALSAAKTGNCPAGQVVMNTTTSGVECVPVGSGDGSVTSVGINGGTTGITISDSPITTSGTMTLGGTLTIGHGGTGASTADGALSALSAAKTGNCPAGQVVMNTTSSGVECVAVATGTGDITGPASSTDNAIPRFDGTTGKQIQNSGITITDTNELELTDTMSFSEVGQNVITIPSTGYLRVGSTGQHDTHFLVVGDSYAGGGRLNFRYGSAGAMWDAVTGSTTNTRMKLTNTGDLKIGSGDPAERLDVDGFIRVSSGYKIDATTIIDSSSNWLGETIPINKGGTGATTADGALSALSAAKTGNCPAGQVVMNTTSSGVECVAVASGTGNISGTGATNKIAYWTDTDTISQNANLHWDNTNTYLGIGTNTPSHQLHIRNDATAAYLMVEGAGDGDNYAGLELRNTAGNSIWQFTNKDTSKEFAFSHNDGTTWSHPFKITSTGDVAIGIATPTDKLHVNGNIRATAYKVGTKTVIDSNAIWQGDTLTVAKGGTGRISTNEGTILIGTNTDTYNAIQVFKNENAGNCAGTTTINWETNGLNQEITLTGNCEINFNAPNIPSGRLQLIIKQDSTGSRTTSFHSSIASNIKTPTGETYVPTSTANAVDIVSFYYDGTNYYMMPSFDFQTMS